MKGGTGSPGAARRPATLAMILAVAAAACRSGEPAQAAHERAREALARLHVEADEMRRRFESRAAEVRNDLEDVRLSAEAVLRERARRPGDAVHRVRLEAGRALRRGTDVLRQAARDGGAEAAGWARIIQERMMRLEASLDALARSDAPHADS